MSFSLKLAAVSALLLAIVPNRSIGQVGYPPVIENAETKIYKTAGDTELKLWVFKPADWKDGDARPAIVFFFGGGWNTGNPNQFTNHCEYLSARGMVAITADYRVASRQGVKAPSCVADAKSAIRWIRKHASTLGVDPDKIVAGGGSAGGHLAAATATLPDHDDPTDDLSFSAQPNALALFNPALILAPIPGQIEFEQARVDRLQKRFGVALESMSPYHHIKSGLPPTIIFHGTGDKTVPYQTAELFQKAMVTAGNSCRLVGYRDEPHGFFNYRRKGNGAFIDTVNKMDAFLVSIGYLPAPPEVVSEP